MRKAKSPLDRFNTYHTLEPESGCWLWTGAKARYGRLFISKTKAIPAHRFSYEIYKGKIPDGMLVCHTCDVPLCVNPEHLWLGTHQDNMNDRQQKNRQAKGPNGERIQMQGENNPKSKLSNIDALNILLSTDSQRSIAKKYKISQAMVSSIKKGKSWKCLTKI